MSIYQKLQELVKTAQQRPDASPREVIADQFLADVFEGRVYVIFNVATLWGYYDCAELVRVETMEVFRREWIAHDRTIAFGSVLGKDSCVFGTWKTLNPTVVEDPAEIAAYVAMDYHERRTVIADIVREKCGGTPSRKHALDFDDEVRRLAAAEGLADY